MFFLHFQTLNPESLQAISAHLYIFTLMQPSGSIFVVMWLLHLHFFLLFCKIDFIANGDILEVVRVKKSRTIYGSRFVDLTLRSLDYDWEIDAFVWLDLLQSDSPAHANQLHQELFQVIAEDYPEITQRRMLVKKIYENEYFNALQVKFAYAVTCHKAQGGQWKKVFIDPGQVSDEQVNSDFYRWMYTALTRASENVFLVNFPTENNS